MKARRKRMVACCLYVTEDQDDRLDELAKTLQKSRSELLREGLTVVFKRYKERQ